jgi:hypothetical protein
MLIDKYYKDFARVNGVVLACRPTVPVSPRCLSRFGSRAIRADIAGSYPETETESRLSDISCNGWLTSSSRPCPKMAGCKSIQGV